jgi:hypothetical protein
MEMYTERLIVQREHGYSPIMLIDRGVNLEIRQLATVPTVEDALAAQETNYRKIKQQEKNLYPALIPGWEPPRRVKP